MKKIAFAVLEMSYVSGYIIIIVLLIRLLLKKQPKIYSYLLWGVVFLRLSCPLAIHGPYSLIPERAVWENRAASVSDSVPQKPDKGRVGPALKGPEAGPAGERQKTEKGKTNLRPAVETAWTCVWLTGIVLLVSGNLFSYLRLRRKVSGAVLTKENVYETGFAGGSFVMGLIHPAIYLSPELKGPNRAYVICHEKVHINRRDYLIKPAALLITCVHWFHPLAWVSFFLMSRDMEMSCDEKVIKQMGSGAKKDYSRTLLNAAAGRRESSKRLVCPLLSFGGNDVRTRIKNILSYRRPGALAAVLISLLLLLAGCGLLFNPAGKKKEDWFAKAVIKEGAYGKDCSRYVFPEDYDGDGREEAFLAAGQEKEGQIEGDIWFVSSSGEARKLVETVWVGKEQEIYDTGKEKYIILSYIGGNPRISSVYGVKDDSPYEALPYGAFKYTDGDQIVCVSQPLDISYDKEMEVFTGRSEKRYRFYYANGSFRPCLAHEISEADFLSYQNGSEIRTELSENNPGASFQYLLRENGELNVNIIMESEYEIRYSYVTYTVKGKELQWKEEGEGYYKTDPTQNEGEPSEP